MQGDGVSDEVEAQSEGPRLDSSRRDSEESPAVSDANTDISQSQAQTQADEERGDSETRPAEVVQRQRSQEQERLRARRTESVPVSPSVSEVGRQTSIVRASQTSESDRAAALRARHRVRSTITGNRPQGRTSRLRSEDGRDTDEETNEALRVSMHLITAPSEPGIVEASPERTVVEEEGEAGKEEKEAKEERRDSSARRRTLTLTPGLMACPALKFITRKDLYSFLSSAGNAGEEFFANRALMELVQRIRADNTLFVRYQHSRHLVKALNNLVDQEADLPDGWEKKLNRQGKVFFIDHDNRLTTFIDPRIPLADRELSYTAPTTTVIRRAVSVEESVVRPHHVTSITPSHSAPPPPAPTSVPLSELSSSEISYEDKVVAFFRQPDVIAQISQRYQRGVRPQLREIIEDIRINGTAALIRIQMSGSVATYELALVLSLFEEEINQIRPQPVTVQPPPSEAVDNHAAFTKSTLQRKKEAFSTKLQHFKMTMARLGFAQGSRLKFNIRRDHLLADAYEHMMKAEIRHLQKKRLNITFRGEEGLDYGGPSREFFFLLSREIFNPYYGLFEYSANDTYTVQVNSTSSFIQNNLDWFRFAGRILGLAIAQGFLLDVFFTRTVYKGVLNRPASLKDLESLEPAFYNSLLWIQENDPEPLDLTFTVEEEAFGQLSTIELKPGGMDIPVTDDNKEEYVELMIRWRLDRGVHKQMESIKKGFNEVMPISLIQEFDAQELEFLMAGTLEIDVDDWKNNTEYRNGYHPTHPVIQWFWQAVEMFDNEQRLRLLQFVTGTSSVPFEGFRALRGSNGPKKFTIDYFNDIRNLPRTHTCFNRIDLPPYPSFEVLYEKLRIAIEEGSTFGIE